MKPIPINGLEVIAAPPTAAGRLYAAMWDDIGLLIESDIDRDWPFGLNIDWLLLFDLDANRILAGVELLFPQSRWSKVNHIAFPTAPPGDLKFSTATTAAAQFNLAVRVESDGDGNVRIEIGAKQSPDRMVGLSETCVALIAHDRLIGFVVRGPIARARR